jgi:hypothetical protein
MRKAIVGFAVAALLAAIVSLSGFGSATELFRQELVVGGVTATVSVKPYPFVQNDFLIEVEFKSSKYPVGCLSAYRDLRYELRDSDGRLVPVSQQALKHPPYEGSQLVMHPVVGGPPRNCATNTNNGIWRAHSVFSALYPSLPLGKYTLRISFTPRETGQHADFAPVPISIEPSSSSP